MGLFNKISAGLPSVSDVFNSYVGLETAKVNARMNATEPQQRAGFNNPGQPQNPQAKTGAGVTILPGGLSMKTAAIGLGGVGALLLLLKITRVI